jgi:carboxylesterase type B
LVRGLFFIPSPKKITYNHVQNLKNASPILFAFAVSNPSVTISAGTVEGTHCPSTNAKQFLNIPYAQPPLDELRFAPPQPYNTSYNSGTIIATTPGPPCIQFGTAFLENGTASEDCLHLDIWAPSKDTQISGLPVKVWIYGGGEQSGGISNPMYNGCNSAAEGSSLVVGINYRLGPLGFLALESAGIAGNQGILDILMGLQWIQENIAAFGGDPVSGSQ